MNSGRKEEGLTSANRDQARTIKKHKHFTEEELHEIEEGTLQELGTTVDEEDHEEPDQHIEEAHRRGCYSSA